MTHYFFSLWYSQPTSESSVLILVTSSQTTWTKGFWDFLEMYPTFANDKFHLSHSPLVTYILTTPKHHDYLSFLTILLCLHILEDSFSNIWESLKKKKRSYFFKDRGQYLPCFVALHSALHCQAKRRNSVNELNWSE